MARAVNDVTIGGFDSHHADMNAVYLAQPVERIQEFEAKILNPMVEAEMSPDGRHVAVVIIAHSDRQDAPGLSDSARRQDEYRVSEARANNAWQWLFEQFANELRRRGRAAPSASGGWNEVRGVSVIHVAAGAGHLLHPSPGNDESKRRQNRRVVFVAMIFPKS
jgi:hypothetical protein